MGIFPRAVTAGAAAGTLPFPGRQPRYEWRPPGVYRPTGAIRSLRAGRVTAITGSGWSGRMSVIVGAERLPEGAGMDPVALRRAVELIEDRGALAQVCVLRHGQVVLDRAFDCRPDSLFLIFSAGKPFVAVLAHLLA